MPFSLLPQLDISKHASALTNTICINAIERIYVSEKHVSLIKIRTNFSKSIEKKRIEMQYENNTLTSEPYHYSITRNKVLYPQLCS